MHNVKYIFAGRHVHSEIIVSLSLPFWWIRLTPDVTMAILLGITRRRVKEIKYMSEPHLLRKRSEPGTFRIIEQYVSAASLRLPINGLRNDL